MKKVDIEIYSDVVCPWCLVGTRRLEQALARIDVAPEVTYRPFLLMPEAPPEGLDVQAMLRRKYGGDPRRMWAIVEGAARETGIDLQLERQPYAYPTLRAHTLMRHAHAKGTQRGLAQALYNAYFLEARNVDDPEVLAEAAAPHGFSKGEVDRLVWDEAELGKTRAEAEAAVERGVRGVPLFLFDRKLAVSGAQKTEILVSALEKVLSGS